ncbi:MAG: NHL repeat-containing protein [Carboxydocellales bacterium]
MTSPHSDVQDNPTITVRQLLIILEIITIIAGSIFALFYLQKPLLAEKRISLPVTNQQPKYLFSIYGNQQKSLAAPMAAYVSPNGNIYISSTNNHEIQVFKPNGQYLFSFGKQGAKPGELNFPYGITGNAQGNILVAETGNPRIQEFTPAGKFVRVVASAAGPVKVEKPGPLYSKDGKVYIGDLVKQQVIVLDPQGKVWQTIKNVNYPHGVAVDAKGRTYVSKGGGYRVAIFDSQGKPVTSISKLPGDTNFSLVRGVALDKAGQIFITDSIASVIQVFSPEGKYLFGFGGQGFEDGKLLYPTGLYINEGTNRIYVADWANNRISVWSE